MAARHSCVSLHVLTLFANLETRNPVNASAPQNGTCRIQPFGFLFLNPWISILQSLIQPFYPLFFDPVSMIKRSDLSLCYRSLDCQLAKCFLFDSSIRCTMAADLSLPVFLYSSLARHDRFFSLGTLIRYCGYSYVLILRHCALNESCK